MPSTQSSLGRGCGHADAGLYAGLSQLNLKSPPEPAQSTTLPVSFNSSLLSPPPYPQRSPEPAPWSSTTRSSGADANRAENAQIPTTLTSHFLEENQYIHAPFPGSPGFSPATSSTWFPTADFTDIQPPLSSHTQGDSSFFLRYPGLLSQAAGHDDTPTQQTTPPTSPDSQSTQEHPTGKRRRHYVPKDPRAAKRLRTQRQGDDENLEALYKLLVPKSAGAVQKKDRLGMSTSPFIPAFLLDDDDDHRVFVCYCQFFIMRESGWRPKAISNSKQRPRSRREIVGPLHPRSKASPWKVLNFKRLIVLYIGSSIYVEQRAGFNNVHSE